jgi:hypothetical protein
VYPTSFSGLKRGLAHSERVQVAIRCLAFLNGPKTTSHAINTITPDCPYISPAMKPQFKQRTGFSGRHDHFAAAIRNNSFQRAIYAILAEVPDCLP